METRLTTSPTVVAAERPPCGCGAGGCDEREESDTSTSATEASNSIQALSVTGMTCHDCVAAVIRELESLDGISHVHVYLDASGTSTVTLTGARRAAEQAVLNALSAAGDFRLQAVWTD